MKTSVVQCWVACAVAIGAGGVVHAAEPAPAPVVARPTIAVLYLDYAGKDEALAQLRKGLAQMLVTDLSDNPKLALVERLQLEAVLEELKLGQTRSIDRASAAKIGKLLGARYLVMGGYFELAKSLRVDVRVVDVETGEVVKGFGVTGQGDDFLGVHQALVKGLDAILSGLGGDEGKGDEGRAPKKTDKPGPVVKKKPQAPPRLRTKTAARYGKALDLMDQGKKIEAKAELEEVVKEEPHFGLAVHDLQRLAQ